MTDQPLGILRSGPYAFADERGAVAVAGSDWKILWWVAGEDRWHRPDVDAAVRQRLIDDTPVVETSVRVPGGDAVGTTYAYASAGEPALAGRVANASPVPVAVALVIGPVGQVTIDGSTVVVEGRHAIELSRRPSATASAPSLDALAAHLPESTTIGSGEQSGYFAVVVPLPHTQAVAWTVSEVAMAATDAPEPEQVAAGWIRHAEEGAQLTLPDTEGQLFVRARHLVAMGAAPDAPIAEVAEHVRAAVSLGWFDAALPGTDQLAAAQRGRGRIGDDDRSTSAALLALASWRRAGIPADGLEHLLGPVLGATRWLVRRLRRLDGFDGDTAIEAVTAAAWFLRTIDQGPAAAQIEADLAGRLAERSNPGRSTMGPAAASGLIDALVADDADGLVLLAGWAPGWGREPVEAADVPTPWGPASFASRWHGARPALLWEVEAWPDVTRSEPALQAPALDPSWRGRGWRGEALLAEPAGMVASGVSGSTDGSEPVDPGESFS